MAKENGHRQQITKWLRRIARIWSFPIIVYALLMFFGYTWSWITTGVADPYVVEEVSLIEALPPILLFVSVLGLGIAWRWEQVGAVISLIFQLATLLFLIIQRPITEDFNRAMIPYLMVAVTVIPGILFLLCYFIDREGA
jgi:hypothetical protein